MPLILGAWLAAGCVGPSLEGVDAGENADSSAPADTSPVAPTCDPVSLELTQDLRPEDMPNHASDAVSEGAPDESDSAPDEAVPLDRDAATVERWQEWPRSCAPSGRTRAVLNPAARWATSTAMVATIW